MPKDPAFAMMFVSHTSACRYFRLMSLLHKLKNANAPVLNEVVDQPHVVSIVILGTTGCLPR